MLTFLTDFGTSDYFVPAVKGAILTIDPGAVIVDITHQIAPQDIEAAAFTLAACYRDFPEGTIHLAVVDPGVGSERIALIVDAGGHRFVGPDNGIFSHIYAAEAGAVVYRIENSEYFRKPASPTFHGRDVFGPVAAWLSRGVEPGAFGPRIDDPARLDFVRPETAAGGDRVVGRVIHIDRFGNCITNLTQREFPFEKSGGASLYLGGRRVARFGTHFRQSGQGGELFAYPGSAGYWEIALWCDSAALRTGAARGTEILLEIG